MTTPAHTFTLRSSLRTLPLLAALLALGVSARANPTGGSVAAGSATITTSGNTLTVTQASGRAIINWQDFSNAAGELTRFIQPDATSATLNRVVSGQPSALFGNIQANGKIFLINPNGILVGAGARIDTGGFLASTLDVANQDFLAGGDLRFSGDSTAAVKNLGAVNALGGDVFLIARQVENAGTVTAGGGTAGVAAGSEILLTTGGSERLFVLAGSSPGATVNSGTITGTTAELKAAGGNAYAFAINNTGLVRATGSAERGGKLWLVSEGGDIANSGTLDVSSATGQGGDVKVTGERVSLDLTSHLNASGATGGGTMFVIGGAKVAVGGSLEARATASGDGGFIETSAPDVKVAGATRITTTAAAGATGTWLIDPVDFTIAPNDGVVNGDMTGAEVAGFLASSNLMIESIIGGSGTAGNINVYDTISWSAHKLTLNAQNNINISAALNGSGTASLALEYGQGAVAAGNTSDYNVNAAVTLPAGNNFSTKLGSDGIVKNYTVITSLGAPGSTTGTDLQGMNGNLTGNYALGASLDASATSGWNSGAGFLPIGDDSTVFTGTFTGLGHTISGLTINRPSTSYVGLFGNAGSGSTIRNLGLVNVSVTGVEIVAGLAGVSKGTIKHSYVTGSVTGYNSVGGLVGQGSGTITNSYATAEVHGGDFTTGGLVGFLDGTISNSYAMGSISGVSYIGGLVGVLDENSTISTSYAVGSISATGGNIGGLVGFTFGSGTQVTNSYWNTETTGQLSSVGGGFGLGTSDMQDTNNFSGFNFTTTPGETGNAWVMVDDTGSLNNAGGAGAVRPMLASEYSTTITNAHQLQLMAMARGASYTLAADLDLAATGNSHDVWDSAGFVPVGYQSARFNGTFDGLGHTLSNLTINRPSNDRIGLFGQTGVGAEILNVGLVDASVTGHTYVGALVGLNAGRIEASSASGSVTGTGDRVGGLAGSNSGSVIDSHATSAISGVDYVGGLVGYGSAGTIDGSYATGAISGAYYVGGLVGYNIDGGTIEDSYATGAVTAIGNVGGLVGYDNGAISDSHATGGVTGSSGVGGLVGNAVFDTIEDSYATGAVTGTGDYSGGLLGSSLGATITRSHATGNVSGGGWYVGGLVGNITSGGTISFTYATGSVSGGGDYVGGLLGYNDANLSASYATGAVTGARDYVGGLVGDSRRQINTSYATGSVSGRNSVGGLVGYNTAALSNSYATGSVSGTDKVGGLVGENDEGGISFTYATGSVNGSTRLGGLVGVNAGSSSSTSYWNTQTSGQAASASGTGKTSAEMQQQATFGGFDVTNTWIVYEGHTNPLLRTFLTALTVTAANATKTYDGLTSVTGNGVTYSATPNSNLLGTVTYTGGGANVGTQTLTPGGLYSHQQGYAITFAPGTLTINPATLTYTANAASRTVGAADPAFSGTVTGFVNSETQGTATTGTLSFTTTATNASPAGSYALTGSGLTANNGNYVFVQAAGNATAFTIGTLTSVPLTITANDATRLYGAANPAFTASYAGFINGDTPSVVTGLQFSTTATMGSNVGTYTITPFGASAPVTYLIGYVPGTLTINPAALSYTANAASRPFGAANPAFSGMVTGFVNGDTQGGATTGTLSFSTTATSSSPVGSYALTGSGLTANNGNYVFAQAPGNATALTIGSPSLVPLTITADNQAKLYGAALPAFTASYAGFINGDTSSSVTGLQFSTTATMSSNVGTYTITPFGATAPASYVIGYVPGTLTINPAALSYTANAASRPFGASNPAFSGTVTGFVNGDTQGTATTGTLSFSTTATSSSPVGSYALTGSGLTANNGNYVFAQAPGNATAFTIGSLVPLTITADNKSKTYGAALPAFTASYAGFINGDTASVVTGLQFSTTATMSSNVGTYTITPFGATAPAAYSIGYVPGTLTINPAALTLTANSASRLYGAANPAFTASYSGLVNGDTSAAVSGLQFGTAATTTSGVGSYALTLSGATAANYTLSYVPGTLTVNPALLTLTANNAEREFGAANPAFTGTFSGFVNGDTSAVVTGLAFTTPATGTSAIGDYAITPTAAASNYTLAFVNGLLRVVAPTVMAGGAPVPVVIIGGQPVLTSSLALVQGNDRLALVFLDSSDDGRTATDGTSVDERLALTLGDPRQHKFLEVPTAATTSGRPPTDGQPVDSTAGSRIEISL